MEELDFQALLDRFNAQGFEPWERVILGHFGTVQTLLSLIFNAPVVVKLIDQTEDDGVIIRQTHLVAGQYAVCYATSHIGRSQNRADIIGEVLAGKLGLGQIVAGLGMVNRRDLTNVGRNDYQFWRRYFLLGPGLRLEITEVFPREPFEAVGKSWSQRFARQGIKKINDQAGDDLAFRNLVMAHFFPNYDEKGAT